MNESAATREMGPPDGPHPTVGAHAAGEERARGVSSPSSASHRERGALLTAPSWSQCIARCLNAWIRFVPDFEFSSARGPTTKQAGALLPPDGCQPDGRVAASRRCSSDQGSPCRGAECSTLPTQSPRAFFGLLDPGWDCGGGGKCICDARGGRGAGAPGGQRCCVPQARPPRGGVAAALHSHALKGFSPPRETHFLGRKCPISRFPRQIADRQKPVSIRWNVASVLYQ
jgi:hypothetical protein